MTAPRSSSNTQKTSLAEMMAHPSQQPPSPLQPVPSHIHWPVVAATALPCLLFVGIIIALLVRTENSGGRGILSAWRSAEVVVVQNTTSPKEAEDGPAEPAIPSPESTPLAPEPEVALRPARLTLPGKVNLPDREDDDPPAQIGQAPAAPAGEPEPADKAGPACQRFGTAVDFVASQMEASRQALVQDKLMFVLHISGNFEEARFT